jgi:ribokinase
VVIVFGSVNLDLVARVPAIPRPGETVLGGSLATLPGGKGANQALAARNTGTQVAMFGAVGRDAFADAALANLARSGVDLAGVARVEESTGVALINVDLGGENAITVVPGANARASASQVPDDVLAPGNTLLMQLEVPLVEVATLARRARSRGARVVLNGAPAMPLARELLDDVDFLVVNEHEAAICVAERDGVNVVLTLGARGARMDWNGAPVSEAPPRVDVVDTTGAGDALCGTFAAALDRGAPPPQALREGVRAGALACVHAGAQRVNDGARADVRM